MKSKTILLVVLALFLTACSHRAPSTPAVKPTAFGVAIVEVSGGKQATSIGSTLDQPVVVQVNDGQGNGVTGALVMLHGPQGVVFAPTSGLTDSSGQFTSTLSVGETSGRYRITATTNTKGGKTLELPLEEIALGYQQNLGRQLNAAYCARCHNPESSRERVSNFDNLDPKPHAFTEGDALNKLTDADLTALITHGGPALGKSPEMPPYGYTLSKGDIQALVAYVRAVSDPPYQTSGVVYAEK
jgi:mono/diheme cytochrome c family protein